MNTFDLTERLAIKFNRHDFLVVPVTGGFCVLVHNREIVAPVIQSCSEIPGENINVLYSKHYEVPPLQEVETPKEGKSWAEIFAMSSLGLVLFLSILMAITCFVQTVKFFLK